MDASMDSCWDLHAMPRTSLQISFHWEHLSWHHAEAPKFFVQTEARL